MWTGWYPAQGVPGFAQLYSGQALGNLLTPKGIERVKKMDGGFWCVKSVNTFIFFFLSLLVEAVVKKMSKTNVNVCVHVCE